MGKHSRAARFAHASTKAGEALDEINELHDELDNWLTNLPENLQGGSKAEELQTLRTQAELVRGGHMKGNAEALEAEALKIEKQVAYWRNGGGC